MQKSSNAELNIHKCSTNLKADGTENIIKLNNDKVEWVAEAIIFRANHMI